MNKRKFLNDRKIFYVFLGLLFSLFGMHFLFDGNVVFVVLYALVTLGIVLYSVTRKSFWVLAIFGILFLVSVGLYFCAEASFYGKPFQGECNISGRVSENVYISKDGRYQTLVLKNVQINGKSAKNIRLSVDLDDDLKISCGDKISFTAEIFKENLYELQNFKTSIFRSGCAFGTSIKSSEIDKTGFKLDFDEKIRLHIKSLLYDSMGDDNGAVAYAVLFGNKNDIDGSVYDAYKSSGTIHLLTISGLHVTFLIMLLGFLLKKCKVRGNINFVVCAFVLLMYMYLCGFVPSVVRAGIMGLVLMGATLCGRRYDNLTSVGFAGILILLFSPLSACDVGFLMSFFCVLSIFVLSPIFTNLLQNIFPPDRASFPRP